MAAPYFTTRAQPILQDPSMKTNINTSPLSLLLTHRKYPQTLAPHKALHGLSEGLPSTGRAGLYQQLSPLLGTPPSCSASAKVRKEEVEVGHQRGEVVVLPLGRRQQQLLLLQSPRQGSVARRLASGRRRSGAGRYGCGRGQCS